MKGDDKNEELDALVARSLVERGELIPTTVDEVLDTKTDDTGALPPSLARLYADDDAPTVHGASPRKAPVPRARSGSALRSLSYVAAFAAGIAAVWAAVVLKPPIGEIRRDDGRAPPSAPAMSTSAEPSPDAVTITKPSCEEECCAGADCGTAEAPLETCPTERTCIACTGLDEPDTLYRLRFGDLLPFSPTTSPESLDVLDLCVKVGPSAQWSCEPARLPSSARPRGRFLKAASRTEDLAGGVAIELRIRDKTTAYGRWWSTIKVGPTSLCRGISVVLENDDKKEVGALSLFLERTYYVELARRAAPAELEATARAFTFQGLSPQVITASGRHVFALGPFDKPDAERLLEQIRDKSSALAEGVRIAEGDDYDQW